MSLAESINRTTAQITERARDLLLGISTYARATERLPGQVTLDELESRRHRYGGGLLQPPAYTPTRWYLTDLEAASKLADMGDLRRAGQLMLAARQDGHLAGVLSTRTGGLVRLPRIFRGDADICNELERGHNSTRSAFDEMCPPSELALLAADGCTLGVGVGEFLPVRDRQYPVFCRYDPQFLVYRWNENQWYYSSHHGLLPITPGDGKWVLHLPGGRVAPWQNALWKAIGQAWIRKQHAQLYKDHWEAKLAHPARVAVAPQGASEAQKEGYFEQVLAWGINTVFGLVPGYDIKLVESNGRGWESFVKTIEQCNEEFNIAIAGQTVTVDGGAGFANAEAVHKAIRGDLIKESADSLAHTANTQMIPVYVACTRSPEQVLSRRVTLEYDVTPPKDRNNEANAILAFGGAVKQLSEALAPHDLKPDVPSLTERFAVPTIIVPVSDEPNAGGDAAQDSALNGAQVTSLVEVVAAVARGELPRDAAHAILKRAFLVDDETADMLLGSAGRGFVPVTAPAAPALPASTTSPEATP